MIFGYRSGRVPFRALAFGTAALLLAGGSLSTGCKGKPHRPSHAAAEPAVAAAPTPDNTPIPVLRTPAGLVLKVDETPAPQATVVAPVAPTPVVTPTAP